MIAVGSEERILDYQSSKDELLLNQILEEYDKLINHVVWKYKNLGYKAGLEYDDLKHEAVIAFIESVMNYRCGNNKFSTYAYIRMKYQIFNLIKKGFNEPDLSLNQVIDVRSNTRGHNTRQFKDVIGYEDIYSFIESSKMNDMKMDHLREDLFNVLDTLFPSVKHLNYDFISNDNLMSIFNDSSLGKDVLIKYFGLEGISYSYSEIADMKGASKKCIIEIKENALKEIRKSDIGKQLMKKYQGIMIDYWDFEKYRVNPLQPPDKILERNELIDDILLNLLKEGEKNEQEH